VKKHDSRLRTSLSVFAQASEITDPATLASPAYYTQKQVKVLPKIYQLPDVGTILDYITYSHLLSIHHYLLNSLHWPNGYWH
jgi:hypothetical protein